MVVRQVLLAGAMILGGCGAEIGDFERQVGDGPGGVVGNSDGNSDDVPRTDPPDDDPEPVLLPCVEGDRREQLADGTCFALVGSSVSWDQAKTGCEALGSELAYITSADEQAAIDNLIGQGRQYGFDELWMGANDLTTEGTFTWLDGSALTYTDWRSGNPNGGEGANCVVWDLDDANRWDDRSCGDQTGYICRRLASLGQ